MRVITVGRDPSNDKVITDPYTSNHHLQIIQHDDGHFTLSDFGSTNGTFVNGQKIGGEIPLNDMDIVRIGNTTIPWRMYFEDVDVRQESVRPQGAEVQPTATDTVEIEKQPAMKTKHRILLVIIAIYIIGAIIVLLVNQGNDDLVGPVIGSVVGALMFGLGILTKARLDCRTVQFIQPNGKKPGSLLTVSGIGQMMLGAIKFRKIENTYVAYTFFMFFLPLFPTGCYRVESVGTSEWKVYGSEEKKKPEIISIYLIMYGLIVWVVMLAMSILFNI